MKDLENNKEHQKLRITFHKETGMYAIKHKKEYTYWLEKRVVNNINYMQCCKSDSEQLPDANKHQCNCSNAKDRLDCGFECYNR